jgi:microsomal dipeptidase-like Zn-dependent dipeptidase
VPSASLRSLYNKTSENGKLVCVFLHFVSQAGPSDVAFGGDFARMEEPCPSGRQTWIKVLPAFDQPM